MKRLLLISGFSIFTDELGNILEWKQKEKRFHTFTKHTDQLRKLLTAEDIVNHTIIDVKDKYCIISGRGHIEVNDNYDAFCTKVKNGSLISGEIYINNKNNGINYGENYENSSLTYTDDELLTHLQSLHDKKKYNRFKKYAVVVGLIRGSEFYEVYSDYATTTLNLDNSLLKLSNNMKIINKKTHNTSPYTYTGSICSSGPNSGTQIVCYEIKMFTVGLFSDKVKFI